MCSSSTCSFLATGGTRVTAHRVQAGWLLPSAVDPALADRTVAVADGRIAAVEATGGGAGRTLVLPALANAHDHARVVRLSQVGSFDVPLEAWPYTEVGEAGSFSILRGPLAGLTGILVEVRRSQRLILSVNLLRRSVLVEVHPDWVSPYAPAAVERLMA